MEHFRKRFRPISCALHAVFRPRCCPPTPPADNDSSGSELGDFDSVATGRVLGVEGSSCSNRFWDERVSWASDARFGVWGLSV